MANGKIPEGQSIVGGPSGPAPQPNSSVDPSLASALANAPAPSDGTLTGGVPAKVPGGGDGTSAPPALPDRAIPVGPPGTPLPGVDGTPVPDGAPGLPDVNNPIPLNATGGDGQEQGMWAPNAFQGDLLAALGGVIPPNMQPGGTPGGGNVQPGGTPGGLPLPGTDGTGTPADGATQLGGVANALNNAIDLGGTGGTP